MMDHPSGLHVLLSIVIFTIAGGITAYFADRRGRDPVIWFFVGMLLGIIGLIILFILPSVKEGENQEEGLEEKSNQPVMKFENKEAIIEPVKDPSHLPFEQRQWFYLDVQHKQLGPVSFSTLKSLWESQNIQAQTYIWSEGMEEWKRIGEMGDLAEHLKAAL